LNASKETKSLKKSLKNKLSLIEPLKAKLIFGLDDSLILFCGAVQISSKESQISLTNLDSDYRLVA
jgi:hypothetical protein